MTRRRNLSIGMPNMVMAILGALVELGRPADAFEVMAASGYEYGSFYRAAAPIIRHRWMDKPWNGVYDITERGKIALAIEVGRRTRARNLGYASQGKNFRDFERCMNGCGRASMPNAMERAVEKLPEHIVLKCF